jgi:4-amino-4-deoxy-L-arabinose transferase-like glycosyltransferase
MGLISILIIYELVHIFLGNGYVAWLAAVFAALSPFHLWTLAVPSTDYSEIFILHLTLWIAYRLFSESGYSASRIITCGLILGILLLMKMDMLLYFFALALIVILRRWWLIPVWTALPFGLSFLYTQFISKWGIAYSVVEMDGRWSSGKWLWLEFIHFTPQEMWHTLADWGGYTGYQVIVLFGVLFVVAVFALSFEDKASRTVIPLGWLMFFSSAAFAFIARISYTSHVLELMPVVYGGAGLGIFQIQTWLEQQYPNRLWIARTAGLVLIAVAVLHLLLQWFVFGIHGSRSIVVLLSPDTVLP